MALLEEIYSGSVSTVESSTEKKYSNYRALVDRAIDVFGSELKASRWLSMPSVDLNGKVPLEIAFSCEYDKAKMAKFFEPIFVRIEHGIYW